MVDLCPSPTLFVPCYAINWGPYLFEKVLTVEYDEHSSLPVFAGLPYNVQRATQRGRCQFLLSSFSRIYYICLGLKKASLFFRPPLDCQRLSCESTLPLYWRTVCDVKYPRIRFIVPVGLYRPTSVFLPILLMQMVYSWPASSA